jgi:hypothetical protein
MKDCMVQNRREINDCFALMMVLTGDDPFVDVVVEEGE